MTVAISEDKTCFHKMAQAQSSVRRMDTDRAQIAGSQDCPRIVATAVREANDQQKQTQLALAEVVTEHQIEQGAGH